MHQGGSGKTGPWDSVDDKEELPAEHGKFKVPIKEEQQCIRDHTKVPTHGHPGVTKTSNLSGKRFTFPNMRTNSLYIKKCVRCQQNKSSRHATYGNLLFSSPPVESWDQFTMDFITSYHLVRTTQWRTLRYHTRSWSISSPIHAFHSMQGYTYSKTIRIPCFGPTH